MEKTLKIGLAGFALVVAVIAANDRTDVNEAKAASAPGGDTVALASVSTAHRNAIDYNRLDQRLRRMAERPTMVGLAVGVVENGRITFLRGYGETVEGSGDEVTPMTVFRWASVSKGLAGTMAAKLAEQGKLSLSAPIATYSPSLRLPGGDEHKATLADVLSHRLGLYRNAYDDRLESGQNPALIRQMFGTLNSICPPGTCWSYQNIAFDAASEAVVKATGKPFEQAVADELFKPLGMSSASISRDGLVRAKSWARPHSAGRRPLDVSEAYFRVPAAGGVNSNIKDLAVWMIAQMGEVPEIVSPTTIARTQADLVKTPPERRRMRRYLERLDDPHYGLGWRSYDYAGHRIVGHRGGVDGYRSLILFDPKKKSGVVAMWNSNTSQPTGLQFEVMDMLYGLEFRDWMELDRDRGGARADDINSGESGNR